MIFPKIKKKVIDFLSNEDGSITKQSILRIGMIASLATLSVNFVRGEEEDSVKFLCAKGTSIEASPDFSVQGWTSANCDDPHFEIHGDYHQPDDSNILAWGVDESSDGATRNIKGDEAQVEVKCRTPVCPSVYNDTNFRVTRSVYSHVTQSMVDDQNIAIDCRGRFQYGADHELNENGGYDPTTCYGKLSQRGVNYPYDMLQHSNSLTFVNGQEGQISAKHSHSMNSVCNDYYAETLFKTEDLAFGANTASATCIVHADGIFYGMKIVDRDV